MSQLPSISDTLQILTQRTETAILANPAIDFGNGLAKKVYFMHGHPKEILVRLQKLTEGPSTKNKKYPLIVLFRDIKETISEGMYGFTSSSKPRIAIITITKPEFRADQRKEKNFDPILIPIFEEFIRQVKQSEFFGSPTTEQLEIVKWDRYYWGVDLADKNILNDYIDAIDIESISLNLDNIICVPESISST